MTGAFGLYLILTDPIAGYPDCASAAVTCGVRYLQLRMKQSPREKVLQEAVRIRDITRGTSTLFLVNDDVDIAQEVDADGIHLGQSDMPIPEARRRWIAPGRQFGLSTHNEEQALNARCVEPDYIGVGPVFPTPTKAAPDPVLGLERMRTIIASTPLPCVAIGGIHSGNLIDVLRHGAMNFCVVRAVNQSPDPVTAIRELQAIWQQHVGRR